MEQETIFGGPENFLKIYLYFGNAVGGNGTFPNLRFAWYQKIRGSISGSKVLGVFLGGSTNALGDYEVVYSVWWLGFYSVE